jgi:8-oxo-dGTP pyrophosphatase MutT (NUDIX family)
MSDDQTASASAGTPSGDTAKAMRPKDAATLLLVDTADGDLRVLMGRRRDDLVFMPGKYVFPGGRVDVADRQRAANYSLSEPETARLLLEMKGEPSVPRATALALAAVRETFEEAGLIIGTRSAAAASKQGDDAWSPFFSQGYEPRLDCVQFFARAITPPGRPRRFDTRFFWTSIDYVAHRTATIDGELSGLHWLTVDEARALDVPTITRVVLDDLMDHLRQQQADASAPQTAPVAVPFYHQRNGSFRRDLLRAT